MFLKLTDNSGGAGESYERCINMDLVMEMVCTDGGGTELHTLIKKQGPNVSWQEVVSVKESKDSILQILDNARS